MVPHDSPVGAEGAPGGLGNPVFDKWALCWEFVERIVSDARSAAAQDNPGHPVPEVDWELIWRAGDGAPSDEWAIGHIIRAASAVARGIAPGTQEPLSAPMRAGPVGGLVDPETLTRQPPAEVDPIAPVESESAPVESVTAHMDPVTAPVEPVTTPVEPVAPSPEPLTAPVLEKTSAVESVTLDRPEPEATTALGSSKTQELPIAPAVPDQPDNAEAPEDGTATARATRTHSGWATVFTWIRNLGAIIILFVVWQLWGTAISQAHAQSQLQASFEASIRAHHAPKATGSGPTLIPATATVPSPADGSVVAELQIPA